MPTLRMQASQLARRARNKLRLPLPLFRIVNRREQKFECPICNYEGPFANFSSFGGFRKYAMCPSCKSLERHRLQYLVMKKVSVPKQAKMLHFAPEEFFKPMFSRQFQNYETADLFMNGVDHKVDIRKLPFENGTYDFVFASHVLEHIREDETAIREIRRVLTPNGIAILPVPIVCEKTIEYSEPNSFEFGHQDRITLSGTSNTSQQWKSTVQIHFRRSTSFSSTKIEPNGQLLSVHCVRPWRG